MGKILEPDYQIDTSHLTGDQIRTYERKVKKRADGSESVRVEARAGHDDMVSTIFIYVGSLDNNQLSGQKSQIVILVAKKIA